MTLTTADSKRIANIVETLFEERELLRDRLDKTEATQKMLDLFGDLTPKESQSISDAELTYRIKSILVVEAVSGTLNDLTPEQIRMFDEAVEGR